jgi:hypothetical protein
MGIKSKLKSILLLFVILALQGCTVSVHCYLVNDTALPKMVEVKYRTPCNGIFYYDDYTMEPTFNLADRLTKTIQASPLDSNVYTVSIPPKSILLLERTMNFNSFVYSSIQIDTLQLISSDGHYSRKEQCNFKRKNLGQYVVWYSIH